MTKYVTTFVAHSVRSVNKANEL